MKNTEECVTIYLENVQISGENESKLKTFLKGTFYKKDGAFYLVYDDSEPGGIAARTFLKISKNSVTMRKMGELRYVMQFEEGTKSDFLYKTPYGDIKMQLATKKIAYELTEKGGTLKLFYSLLTGGEETENALTLEVKQRSVENED